MKTEEDKSVQKVAIVGTRFSHSWEAACRYAPKAEKVCYTNVDSLLANFAAEERDVILLPVYNTREGESKNCSRVFNKLKGRYYWADNLVLPVNISFGCSPGANEEDIDLLVLNRFAFKQCEDYIDEHFPSVNLIFVNDVSGYVAGLMGESRETKNFAVFEREEVLSRLGLTVVRRDIIPHSRTRYGVFAKSLPMPTGYDATSLLTIPLSDRVGILVDILNEFTDRGINILDMRSENDTKSQKLQIYIEVEGHIQEDIVAEAVNNIEKKVIQQEDSFGLIGSYPRVDMRRKYINSFGFIGTGEMSLWFARRLENEGYMVSLSGRSTELTPEDMISSVDVVLICVPISATASVIAKYAPLLADGQALIILAGEAESIVDRAIEATSDGVEVMLVHNLWGPQAANMKDKNAIVVRTPQSGRFCAEFEAFLYKHGANIVHDTPDKHDLLMGVGQKLPTAISVALATTLEENNITPEDLEGHCTLTSLYPILAMARVHSQNPRTYAEILSMSGKSGKIVEDFIYNLQRVMERSNLSDIESLSEMINENGKHLSAEFLREKMKQAKAVDQVLIRMN